MKKTIKLKNAAFMAVVLSLLMAFSSAQAHDDRQTGENQSGWYLSGSLGKAVYPKIGFEVTQSKLDRKGEVSLSGNNVSLALGHRLNKNIRIEGEYFYVPYEITDAEYSAIDSGRVTVGQVNATNKISGTVKVYGFMANVYYDLDITKWVPFVGVGVGFGKLKYDGRVEILGNAGTGGGNDSTMLAQIQTGLGYQLNENWSIYGMYKLFYMGETKMEQESRSVIYSDDSITHHIIAGVKYAW